MMSGRGCCSYREWRWLFSMVCAAVKSEAGSIEIGMIPYLQKAEERYTYISITLFCFWRF
jgi:hypothetical protein